MLLGFETIFLLIYTILKYRNLIFGVCVFVFVGGDQLTHTQSQSYQISFRYPTTAYSFQPARLIPDQW